MPNADMRSTWTDNAVGWVRHQSVFDAVFAPVTAALVEAAGFAPGQRVLDVGCGTGTLLAAAVDAGAEAVGVDISAPMVDAARRRTPSATVLVADAQEDPLPGPFDVVVSRFGVMFFDDPVRAFANVRTATRDEGRMVFACWRSDEENPMFDLGTSVLVDRMDPKPERARPGEPGPTAYADRERLLGLVRDAGWSTPEARALDFVCDFGTDGSDGVESRLATILSTVTGRTARLQLEPRLGPEGWVALLDDVRAELRRHQGDAPAVAFPGATWLVTAVAG